MPPDLWRVPRTWIPGELVTDTLANQHWRDQFISLHSEHYQTQMFRGLHLRTHPDADLAAARVMLVHADEIVMDTGIRVPSWDTLSANIAAAGAGGLDTGSEAASTMYQVYAIRKSSDGTKNLLLHRDRNYYLEESGGTAGNTNQPMRDATARQKLGQGFQVDAAQAAHLIDLNVSKVGAPTGVVWLTIETDSAGNPSGTVLATSQKFAVDNAVAGLNVVHRFIFRTPATLATGTTYHIVVNSDVATSATNHFTVLSDSANSYARGSLKQFDGTTWAAASLGADLIFSLYMLQNDTAVVMPSGYDQRALIGYVYNNASSNFTKFFQINSHVLPLEELFVQNGLSTANVPILVALPYVPLRMVATWFHVRSSVNAAGMAVGPVPDGAGGGVTGFGPTRSGFQMVHNAPTENTYILSLGGSVLTEYAVVYAMATVTGADFWLTGWDWLP